MAIVAACVLLTLAACMGPAQVPGSPRTTAGLPPAEPGSSQAGDPEGTGILVPVADLPTACDLITPADVESVVGEPVEASSSGGACFWQPVADAAGYSVILTLAPLDEQSCRAVHQALGDSTVFEYEGADAAGATGFWQYRQTLAETYIGTYELCTAQVNVGLRVEGPKGAPADEAGQRAMADGLAPLVLQRLSEALQG